MAYIAAHLKQKGHTCQILDGVAQPEPIDQIVQKSKSFDLVGISVVSAFVLRALELIQALKKEPGTPPVVVGGPHVTAMPESMLRAGADLAVVGEGEATMLEIADHLGQSPGTIAGVARIENGQYMCARPRPRLDPLDQVPLPDRSLLPMHLYRSSIARASAQPSHSLLTSRGCPGICSFCSKLSFGTKVRYFSTERILEEFFLLRDRYGARDVAVWDDNFVSNPAIASAVCEGLQRRGFGRTWSVEARIDTVNREVLRQLKAAGCTYIAYGIESGTQRMLDYINKRITLDQIRQTVAMTKAIGIPIRGYFMFGLPTETVAEMEATVRFALELDVELASFTLCIPLPGTREYRRAKQSGTFDPEYYLRRITPEFNFPDSPIYIPEGMTGNELLSFHRRSYNRYYFRPRMVVRKLAALRSPKELWALLMGTYTLAVNAIHRGEKA